MYTTRSSSHAIATRMKVARSSNGGATFATTSPSAGPFLLAPVLDRAEDGALDLLFYEGKADTPTPSDTTAALREASSLDHGASFEGDPDVAAPVLFGNDGYLTSTAWVGDYVGMKQRDGIQFTTYAVNEGGVSHVAFSRRPAP